MLSNQPLQNQNTNLIKQLHLAAKQNESDYIKELIGEGVDINAQDSQGKTALYLAAENNHVEAFKVLFYAKANPSIEDKDGKTLHDLNYLTQDILSVLYFSFQDCLIQSMQSIGYLSNPGGVCEAYIHSIASAALVSYDTLLDHLASDIALRNLRLHPYQFAMYTDKAAIKKHCIYLKKTDDNIEYYVISPQGKVVTDSIKLKVPEPFSLETAKPFFLQIRHITDERGHTQLGDLKRIQQTHDKIASQGENEARQALSLNQLRTPEEKQTFERLVLEKIKLIRRQLPDQQKKEELQLFSHQALFDACEIEYHLNEYASLFPIKNPGQAYNTVNRILFHMLRPKALENPTIKIFYRQFIGAYLNKEFPMYFEKLRKRIKEKAYSKPVILTLNSTTHILAVIYWPLLDEWLFININKLPRHKQEIPNFFFSKDKDIANQVKTGLFLKEKHVLIETVLYSKITCKQDNSIRKIFDAWMKDLIPFHIITKEKATLQLCGKFNYLYLAASRDDRKKVASLMKMGADVNVIGPYKRSPLFVAVMRRHYRVVNLLLTSLDLNLNQQTDDGFTSLMAAASHGHTKILRSLIEATHLKIALDPNLKDKDGNTALHLATINGHYDCVKLLIKAKYKNTKINIESVNAAGFTPVDNAIAQGFLNIFKRLYRTGQMNLKRISAINGYSLLHMAITFQQRKIINFLLRLKELDYDTQDAYKLTPLLFAIHLNKMNIAKKFLKNPTIVKKMNPNTGGTSQHWTMLHRLAINGETNLLQLILETEFTTPLNINSLTYQQSTPLHLAAQEGHIDVISLLLKAKANVNIKNKNGYTPLFTAYANNKWQAVLALLAAKNIDLEATFDSQTLLFLSANDGQIEITRTLIDHHANLNVISEFDGATPLYMAAKNGHYECVQLLLEAGANPLQTLTMAGSTPKAYPSGEYPPFPHDIALKNGHNQVTHLLQSYIKAKEQNKAPRILQSEQGFFGLYHRQQVKRAFAGISYEGCFYSACRVLPP